MEVEVHLEPNGWVGVGPGALPNSLCVDVLGREPRDLNLERISRVVVHSAADASRVRRSNQLEVPVLIADVDLIPRPDAVRVKRGIPVEFDILLNDDVPVPLSPKIRVIESPEFGDLEDLGGGRFRYTASKKARLPNEDVMRYRLVVEEGTPSYEVEVRFFIGRPS